MERKIDLSAALPDDLFWMNEPKTYRQVGGENENGLVIDVEPDTDFWQRTHYGFRRDSGHSLLVELEEDFTLTVGCSFGYSEQYHQAGVILYSDSDNWIKASIEYENPRISRLGSVVTNLGWSDWATSDISSETDRMVYRLHKRGNDCALECSRDGEDWMQLRVTHLHAVPARTAAGLYACSPLTKPFEARFDLFQIGECSWDAE